MKIVIFGGTGFIGSYLCAALTGYDIHVFDKNIDKNKLNDKNITFYEGDFSNLSGFLDILQNCDIIFHLISATVPQILNKNTLFDLEANVFPTIKMLDFIVSKNKDCKIIYISSGGTIYGNAITIPIDESHPKNPICEYGIGKLTIEKYMFLYHKKLGLNYYILRISNPYGFNNYQNCFQGIIPIFLKKSLFNEPIEIWGNGNAVRDYIYIDDVILALITLIEYNGKERIFNIGSGVGTSINKLLKIMEKVIDRKIHWNYLSGRSCDVEVNILNVDRAKKKLEWQPSILLREGIEKTFYDIKNKAVYKPLCTRKKS